MDFDALLFDGFRFFLAGFDSQNLLQVKSDIVNEGGVVFDEYGPDCTHVVVFNLVYDDIICATARRDGKTVVTSLWLDQSFAFGHPVDASNIMYRPPRDLNGIPGAEKLKISVTGYHGPEREDIKTLVCLTGAEFSKQLKAYETTHLVCFKFEGEKYMLAKMKPYTKIVNHQWLTDCLNTWKLLPEEPYSTKSGYEISLMGDQSEEKNTNVTRRKNSWITNLQHEIGEAPNDVMIPDKPIPSRQEGISRSSIVNNEMLPKYDLSSASKDANEFDKQQTWGEQDQYHVNAEHENDKGQNVAPLPSNQIINGAPSISIDRENSANLGVEKLNTSNYSRKRLKKNNLPVNIKEDLGTTYGSNSDITSISKTSSRSRASLQGTKKVGKSDINHVPASNFPINKEEASPRAIGVSSPKTLNNSVARKYTPLKSGRKLSNLGEEVIAGMNTTNEEAGLVDGNSGDPLLPRKRVSDGTNDTHNTLKSQKLTASASKRVDASEPITPASNPLVRRKSGAPDSGLRIGHESDKVSSRRSCLNGSSTKSSAKNVDPSTSLPFELLQGTKPINSDVLVSPSNNKSASTSSGVESKMCESENTHKPGVTSGTNGMEGVKSGSPKLNSGDQTRSSVSKPPRMKMVARRTLGSRPKLSKISAEAQRSSASRISGHDAAVHQMNQENQKEPARSDEVPEVPMVDESVCLGSRPNQKSLTDMVDNEKLLEEISEDQSELEVNNSKHLEAELSSDVLHQVSDSTSDKTSGQELRETIENKQRLVSQKKGKTVKAKKKTLMGEADTKYADEAEGGKNSDEVTNNVVGAGTKKRRGTLVLNKSKSSVEVENEKEVVHNNDGELIKENEVINNDYVIEGVIDSEKLELENRRSGTEVSKKSKGAVQKNNDNTPVNQGGDTGEKCPTELAASSKTAHEDVEDKRKSEPTVGKDEGESKDLKKAGKLAGRKRRDTLILRKSDNPDEANKENMSGSDDRQHPMPEGEVEEENVRILSENQRTKKGVKQAGKKRRGALSNKTETRTDEQNENESDLTTSESKAVLSSVKKHELKEGKKQSACFIVSGHRLQRKEFQQLIKRLKGKVCRDSHQWSYQATHFIVPDPIRRTEKFFAAAASGSWILKTDYLSASSQAGKLLPEEPYEWHKNSLTEDGAISLEAPRKWRRLRERTGHGAFYGMKIVIYGECIAPPLDTLKRAVKAGDGTILATSPPYTRFLQSGVDFAIISPGMPRVDIWVQEFLRHQIPCILADYLVEYVCKPGYSLDRHVLYSTHEYASKSFSKLLRLSEEVIIADDYTDADPSTPENQVSEDLACQVCGSTDRGEVMLICGDERGTLGCGIGTHIDCCDPPLEGIPEDDWFCPKCTNSSDEFPGL